MDKTVDSIIYKDIFIVQPKNGFRFSVDSPLLFRFINKNKIFKNALDIGSGSGVLSVLLAKQFNIDCIDAVEIDKVMYECLVETIKMNRYENKIYPHNNDIFRFKPDKMYDLVICNPPYRNRKKGRVCKSDIENQARFDDLMPIDKLFSYVRGVIKNRGYFYICYDADLLVTPIYLGRKYGLEPKRIQLLHPNEKSPAKIVFIEFIKDAGVELKIEPPIFQNSKEFEMLLKE